MDDQKKPFVRSDFARGEVKLLRDGHFANAVVTRVTLDGKCWTVKDFASRSCFVRWVLAPFLLSHELKILRRLKGVDGVAGESFRVDRNAIAVRFMEGQSLSHTPAELVTPEWLEKLEALIKTMHERGVVHLDLRATGNVIYRPDGTPGLIDFQASQLTGWMPGFLRRTLERIDNSGVLKKWKTFQPDHMGEERLRELEDVNKIRRFWIFRGYFGLRRKRK